MLVTSAKSRTAVRDFRTTLPMSENSAPHSNCALYLSTQTEVHDVLHSLYLNFA